MTKKNVEQFAEELVELDAHQHAAKSLAALAARQEAGLIARKVFIKRREFYTNQRSDSTAHVNAIQLENDNVLHSRIEAEGERQTKERMNETYVVDGTNVCWWSKEASIQPLLTILVALLENGDDFYCVFDAPITRILSDADAASIEKVLEDHPMKFFRVTGYTRADGAILHYADHHSRSIITNDIFRDYKKKHPWLSNKHTERLVQGNLQPSGLMTLEKLPYGQLSLQTDTELSLSRLYELLAVLKDPELSELDKQLLLRPQTLAEIDNPSQVKDIQIDDLESHKQKEIFENQTVKRDAMRIEMDELTAKLNETRASLEALYEIRDFDAIEKNMKEKQGTLKSVIASLETYYSEKKESLANLELEAKQYQAVLGQKKMEEEAHKLELRDDQVCIQKAQAAISTFLEPYSPYSAGRSRSINEISFEGASWDTAVKKLKIFFDRNRICTHCYLTNPVFKGKCLTCQKGTMTDNPNEIWKIIEQFAPK